MLIAGLILQCQCETLLTKLGIMDGCLLSALTMLCGSLQCGPLINIWGCMRHCIMPLSMRHHSSLADEQPRDLKLLCLCLVCRAMVVSMVVMHRTMVHRQAMQQTSKGKLVRRETTQPWWVQLGLHGPHGKLQSANVCIHCFWLL